MDLLTFINETPISFEIDDEKFEFKNILEAEAAGFNPFVLIAEYSNYIIELAEGATV